jgi:predicted transcriptional regulator
MADPNRPRQDLTPVELLLMRAVWDSKTTTREIYDSLPESNRKRLAFSTVSTYLMRLVQKGYLKREPTEGREYEYTALVAKEAVQDQMLEKAGGLFERESDLLSRFAGRSSLTQDERRQLEAIAKKIRGRGR